MIACSCLASALLAVGGMTNGVQIARTPVTNAEYAEFANATGHSVPRYWKNGTFPKGKDSYSAYRFMNLSSGLWDRQLPHLTSKGLISSEK